MKAKVIGAVVMSLLCTGWSGIAAADRCKDVTVKVQNKFEHDGDPIQIYVTDFDYYDDEKGKWREENWVGNIVVGPGDTKTIATRNLEYVGDTGGVILRVQYKYMTAKNGWSEMHNAQSAPFFCKKDGPNSKTVVVEPL
jgi:hypothetical protein